MTGFTSHTHDRAVRIKPIVGGGGCKMTGKTLADAVRRRKPSGGGFKVLGFHMSGRGVQGVEAGIKAELALIVLALFPIDVSLPKAAVAQGPLQGLGCALGTVADGEDRLPVLGHQLVRVGTQTDSQLRVTPELLGIGPSGSGARPRSAHLG